MAHLLLLASVLVGLASAQPTEEWVARYNGPAGGDDCATDIVVDDAGSVYVTGWSNGVGTGRDYTTIKYGPTGALQWLARYNGPANAGDEASALAVDGSGNVYVTGGSANLENSLDIATVKYDAAGVQSWAVRFHGTGAWDPYGKAEDIALDPAGGICVAGMSQRDYVTIKYDSAGTQQWVAFYNGTGDASDEAKAVAVDDSSNVYVAGCSVGFDAEFDYTTVKYDATGVQKWVNRYSYPYSWHTRDCATAMTADRAGNVYVTGWSRGPETGYDYATVKYNVAGAEEWVARYSGSRTGVDRAYAVAADDSGNVYVTGMSTDSMPGHQFDCATLKYNAAGVLQWVARHNGPNNGDDGGYALAVDDAGDVYVAGHCIGPSGSADCMTIKYSAAGFKEWVALYNGPGNGYDVPHTIALDHSDGVYVTGWSQGAGGDYDYMTIKYHKSITGVGDGREGPETQDIHLTVGANPVRGAVVVRYILPPGERGQLDVIDATGRVVETYVLAPSPSANVPSTGSGPSAYGLRLTPNVPPGVYFLRLTSATRSASAKLVKLE